MVCPELLGGFTTPREPAEIIGGTGEDVLNGTARIVTDQAKTLQLYIWTARKNVSIRKRNRRRNGHP